MNKIKGEVKLALNDCLNSDIIQTANNKNVSYANEVLIATLREEITFLHYELNSKDKVIQLIKVMNSMQKQNECLMRNQA